VPIARRNGQAGPHQVRGVITLVQEDRFTLCCDDGSYRLFLLSPHCPADLPELEQAMRRELHVVVESRDAPDLIAAEATRIYQDDQGKRA
jgi:hypothetical protein